MAVRAVASIKLVRKTEHMNLALILKLVIKYTEVPVDSVTSSPLHPFEKCSHTSLNYLMEPKKTNPPSN